MLLIAALLGVVGGLLAGGRLANLLGQPSLRPAHPTCPGPSLRDAGAHRAGRGDRRRAACSAIRVGVRHAHRGVVAEPLAAGLLLAMAGVGANAIATLANGVTCRSTCRRSKWSALPRRTCLRASMCRSRRISGWHSCLTLGHSGTSCRSCPCSIAQQRRERGRRASGCRSRLVPVLGDRPRMHDPDVGVVSLWNSKPRVLVGVDRLGVGRPVLLGSGMGMSLPTAAAEAMRAQDGAVLVPPRTFGERVAAHPYVRLARDARFSAFWLASMVSLFGDRLHQIALESWSMRSRARRCRPDWSSWLPRCPTSFLGPIAGTFVDRWDKRWVMIISDLLRAGLVLLIPFVVEVDIWLVYPIVFLTTTVSLFFRPAKAAVVPRIVARADLMPANGALLSGEALADIAGYPLAGVFVAFLGSNLALAFWVDSIAYLVSAVLLVGIVVPPVIHEAGPRGRGASRRSSRSFAKVGASCTATGPSSRTRW